MRQKITNETWEQIKTGYAAGVGLREIARKMKIPEGTVLAHAKRHGWRQQIEVAARELSVIQSDAITPLQSVPQSLAAILAERKERTKLGLSKYTAEAAEQAAEHQDKLGIAGKVKDVADVHKALWPQEQNPNAILNVAILTGAERPTRVFDHDQNATDEKQTRAKALEAESPHALVAAKNEGQREVTWQSRDTNLSPPQIAAQEKRQKEAEYRERCRDWRRYT